MHQSETVYVYNYHLAYQPFSSNVTYIFGLRFGAMLVTIIGLSGLLCICGRYFIHWEREGKVIGLIHLWGWQVSIFEKLPDLCYFYPTYSKYLHILNCMCGISCQVLNVTGDISFNTFKTLINKWDSPNCNCSLSNVNIY